MGLHDHGNGSRRKYKENNLKKIFCKCTKFTLTRAHAPLFSSGLDERVESAQIT